MTTSTTSTDNDCPVCFETYNSYEEIKCIIPCREGHVVCLKCLKIIYNLAIHQDLSADCWLLGAHCRNGRPHARCPMCRDVFHVTNDDIDSVLRFPETQDDFDDLLQRRRALRRDVLKCTRNVSVLGKSTVKQLESIKEMLNDKTMSCRVAKVSGAVTSIVGGTLFIVGAALAIPTMGAATPLMIAGAAVSGVGGATASGAAVADLLINKNTQTETEELWAQCEAEYADLCDKMHQLQLQDSLVVLGVKCAYSFGGTAGSLVGVIRLATILADVSTDTASTLFRVAGVAGRVIHIAGMVFASALLVFDIVCLVWNSVDIANKEPAAFSKKISEVIDVIQSNCIEKSALIETQLEKLDQDLLV